MGIKKQGVAAYALSALDIGLWDIAGKAARLPLYKLWGAVTDRGARVRQRRLVEVQRERADRRSGEICGARLQSITR